MRPLLQLLALVQVGDLASVTRPDVLLHLVDAIAAGAIRTTHPRNSGRLAPALAALPPVRELHLAPAGD